MDDRKIRLQKLLKSIAKGYKSHSDLARAMGIPVQAFGTYIRGTSLPEGENFRKIAEFLKISGDELNAQLLGMDLNGAVYQVNQRKASDIIPIAAQLPDSEKIALVKYLVNTLDVVVS